MKGKTIGPRCNVTKLSKWYRFKKGKQHASFPYFLLPKIVVRQCIQTVWQYDSLCAAVLCWASVRCNLSEYQLVWLPWKWKCVVGQKTGSLQYLFLDLISERPWGRSPFTNGCIRQQNTSFSSGQLEDNCKGNAMHWVIPMRHVADVQYSSKGWWWYKFSHDSIAALYKHKLASFISRLWWRQNYLLLLPNNVIVTKLKKLWGRPRIHTDKISIKVISILLWVLMLLKDFVVKILKSSLFTSLKGMRTFKYQPVSFRFMRFQQFTGDQYSR